MRRQLSSRVTTAAMTFAIMLAMLIVANVGVLAQVVSGNLAGTVTDKSGAAVANARVEVENQQTGVKTATKSNERGEYRFNNLPIGQYTIRAGGSGFATTTIRNFPIELNMNASSNIVLPVAGAVESVEVTDVGSVIDTTTAQLQTQFGSKENSDLPTASIGLGVLNLALLAPGVSTSGGLGAGTGPVVGGQRPRNNNFTIEGVDNNNKTVTGPLAYVPNDAVAEFSALQNQFGAEFGHSSGGQFNEVVESGTNTFHGKAYEYLQNRNLNAVDQATRNAGFTKNQRFDNNRFGGQMGGPIVKNKLFFFANGEYNPIGQASVQSSSVCTPTAAGYATLSAIPSLSQTNLGILKKFAAAAPSAGCGDTGSAISVANTPVEVGVLPLAAPNFNNTLAITSSVDYNISDRDQLRGRWIYNKNDSIDNAAELPVFFQPLPQRFHVIALNEYHTFSPRMTNELRIGFNRFSTNTLAGNFQFPGLDQFPNLQFQELNLQIGPNPNGPQFTIQNHYQLSEGLTWTRGRHTLKFGYEFHDAISPQSFTQRQRGDYDYSSLDLFLRDLSPDQLGERSLGNPVYYGNQLSHFGYANDQWKIRDNVTLNLGLRYEYTGVPEGEKLQALNSAASVPGVVNFATPSAPKKDFAPRVGIAWSPGKSGDTSVRAGFGMSYDVRYDNIGILSLPPQLSGTNDVPDLTVQTPNFLANGGLPFATGIQTFPTLADQRAATANWIVPNEKYPYSMQWNFGVQHVFNKDYTVEVRYLGTRGVHLNTQSRINRRPKVSDSSFLPTFMTMPDAATIAGLSTTLAQINAKSNFVPLFANAGFNQQSLVSFLPNGGSIYHGLATQVTRRFKQGLQFSGAYTWSHTIDDSTADFFSTVLTPRRPQDFQNLANDRGTSALDRRHRVTFALLYDVPFFKQGNAFMKNVLGNWEFAPIYTYESPEMATAQSGLDSNLNGDAAGDRTIFNASGTPGVGSDVTAITRVDGIDPKTGKPIINTVGYVVNNPNAQYIVAGKGALSNAARNSIATGHINDWDLSAVKRISITERFKTEFQAQFLNLFNHPQFVPGRINRVDSTSNTTLGASNFLTPSSGNFMVLKDAFASNARAIQLGLKVIW